MAEGICQLIPTARVGHLGLQRDHTTLQPIIYYQHMPPNMQNDYIIITDPMLATGGSILATIQILKEKGCTDIRIISLIAAPEGIKAIHEKYPEVAIYVAQVDEKLNSIGYIMPGLGDAGDRIFGTVE